MWVGWNATLSNWKDHDEQKVGYMANINESPTSNSVVQEVMKRSQKVAAECQRKSIAVTCDSVIPKPAMQIQSAEKPKYDNLFILLGSFHHELALFKIIGKFIAESGPHILTETGLLASGSLNGFISGKAYNRCKRLHMLFSGALQAILMTS